MDAFITRPGSFRRCHSSLSLVEDERHGPAPAGTGLFNLHRQARNVEAVWARDLVEISEFLDLAILALDARKMSRPNISAIARAAIVGDHISKRAIECVGIDADHLHPLFHQPQRSFAPQSGLSEVVR